MTTTGGVSDARAAIRAEIDAAAPRPVPAERAIALVGEIDEPDVAVLGALAYEALTGVAPGADPTPPAELVSGFPPFASEVLMRALTGPEERRPTSQAMVVVLEMVPASAWPPPAVASSTGAAAATPAAAGPVREEQVVEEAEAVPQPTAEDADEQFRNIVGGRHTVPRFEPLEGAGELPLPTVRGRRRRRRKGGAKQPAAVERPVAADPEPRIGEAEREPDVQPDPGDDRAARKPRAAQREERRRAKRESRREAKQRREREPRREKDPARGPAGEARDQTLVLVAVLIVLIVLGVLYAMSREDTAPSPAPPAEGAAHSAALAPTS